MIWCSRIWFNAGTQLLLISAPPIPPIKIPTQIMLTLLGSNGTGPVKSIPTKKNTMPKRTIFWKFFFDSGTKLRTVEVSVYVIVSMEKMMPMTQTEISSSFNLNYNNGSLKVRHINEVDIHSAVAVIFYIKIKINK